VGCLPATRTKTRQDHAVRASYTTHNLQTSQATIYG
jgi:hypothetical protein